MPIGTGYSLEHFCVGDAVTIEFMFDESGWDFIHKMYEGTLKGSIGEIVSISSRGRLPLGVKLTDLRGRERKNKFSPNELVPIIRIPDWEI